MGTANAIVSTGNTYRIYDSSVETHNRLPVGTYKVNFSPMAGFSLAKVDDLVTGEEKVYGNHARRLDRIVNTYDRFDRSLGVMLSGDKGMGKSLMVRMIAEEARERLGLPVIIVNDDAPGIADFIDSIDEAVVIFDEFEKNFSLSEEENSQHQFLGLFDGTSSQRRLYVITVNSLANLSSYFLNRPGRFHYHLRFDYPSAEQTRRYLQDKAPDAFAEQVEIAVAFSRKVHLNYDHLRAIAFELNAQERFGDVIDELNIKRVMEQKYRVELRMSCGQALTQHASFDLFSPDDGDSTMEFLVIYQHPKRFELRFDVTQAVVAGDVVTVPPQAIEVLDKSEGLGDPVSLELSLAGQESIGF